MKTLAPKHVRNLSDKIASKIIDQCKELPKVQIQRNGRSAMIRAPKAVWLTLKVDAMEQRINHVGIPVSRLRVAKALKDFYPGKLRPHPTEFAGCTDRLWSRFSYQAKVLSVNQAELLAYFVITGEE